MEKFELHNKIVQQLRFHRISGLDEEECANNILSLVQTDWTEGCSCYHGDTTGETWCCNKCGKPTSRHPSPSLPSDEEGLMREIFGEHYLKLIEVKYSSPAQYNDLTGGTILAINYFKEKLSVYSTRIAEMEREMKGLTEALKGELVLNDLLRDGHFKNKDGMPIVKYIDKPNKGDVAYIRHDAMVKKINSIIKSTTTP